MTQPRRLGDLSPTVAVVSFFLAVSYLVLLIAPSAHVFATMTNLCYLAAGLWREAVSASSDRRLPTLLAGQLTGGSLILVLMGASSFAFHRESEMSSPAHTFDIFFAWLLVAHICYVSFSVVVLAVVHSCSSGQAQCAMRVTRLGVAVLFLAVIVVLMAFYDTVYTHQPLFFLLTGSGAAVLGGASRGLLLVFENGKLQWRAVRLAAVEMAIALTVVLAAVFAQGELLGPPLSRDTTPKAYDFYHGQWHFLLALVVSLLYARASHAAQAAGSDVGNDQCVCDTSVLDLVAGGLIFTYALLVIAFREFELELLVAKGVLGTLAGLFALHGLATLQTRFCLAYATTPVTAPPRRFTILREAELPFSTCSLRPSLP